MSIEYLLIASHCPEFSTKIISFHFYNNFVRSLKLLKVFTRIWCFQTLIFAVLLDISLWF